jgi:hypothetical protein
VIDLFREALAVQEFLAEGGWPFCFWFSRHSQIARETRLTY